MYLDLLLTETGWLELIQSIYHNDMCDKWETVIPWHQST